MNMMPINRNMTEEERKMFRRESYEIEKEDLIATHKEMGFPKETLNVFLVNSLKQQGYETELKEDGLI